MTSLHKVIVVACVLTAACSSDPVGPHVRPGDAVDSGDESPDYSAVLSDPRIRFESDTLRLSFEEGGVLYSSDGPKHRFVDLESGVGVVFDRDAPSLVVNGRAAVVDQCRLIGENETVEWYVTLPDTTYIVVEKP